MSGLLEAAQIIKATNSGVDRETAGQLQARRDSQLQWGCTIGTTAVRTTFREEGLLNTTTGNAFGATQILKVNKIIEP